MRKCVAALALMYLSAIFFMGTGAAQTSNGQVGGIVQDTSNALVPGVSVTLTNNDTGITTTQITNESGAYTFLSVPPGTYRVTGTLPGFKTAITNNVAVGVAAQVRVNITIEVGAVDSRVEVSVSSDQLMTEASASVGDVLTSDHAKDLPLVGDNILDLVKILPGYGLSHFSTPGQAMYDIFAGQTIDTVNVTRDGLTVNGGRNNPLVTGLSTTTNINPELVGEIRLVLTPVDAELGRGASQVQIQTRSGTNRYTGSAIWRVQNSALNANTWLNNHTINANGEAVALPWRNANNITVTYGGPILRNKTFFFATWEQQLSNTRTTQTNTVYTESARQGIFRYWEGWNPLDADLTNEPVTYPVTATTAGRRSVDFLGNPVRPDRNADGTPYTGRLMCFSIFGSVKVGGGAFTQADCPGGTAVINGNAWDPIRSAPDSTGFMAKILDAMPRANDFTTGDGLNTAAFRWERGAKGQGGANALAGVADLVNRKEFNIKIDHNFNTNHRVNGSWSYQRDDSADFLAAWPGGLHGETTRRPQVFTLVGTSTLSSSLLNEARFGLARDNNNRRIAVENSNPDIQAAAQQWYLTGGVNPENGAAYPVAFNPAGVGMGTVAINNQSEGSSSPLYSFADTLSWAKGRHAFKGGAEVRLIRSNGFNSTGGSVLPVVTGGAPNGYTSVLNSAASSTDPMFGQLTGFLANAVTGQTAARANAANLLYFMNGSVMTASMLRWIDDSTDVANGHWDDITTSGKKYRDQKANEWAVFFKDDWKLTKDLTLNLGLRYEYYGSPYIGSGFTTAPVGLAAGLFGNSYSGAGLFDRWLLPGSTFLSGYGTNVSPANALACSSGVQQSPLLPTSTCDPNKLTRVEFVGPNTPNPDKVAIPVDRDNFGPAVGFAWQVPWFGAGKTTVRGGYQVSFNGAQRNGGAVDTLLGSAPGSTNAVTFNIDNPTTQNPGTTYAQIMATRALNLTDIANIVPLSPTAAPGQTLPIYGRSINFRAYDPNYRTPYSQNLTLQVTRSLTRNMTLDVRYVGTLARKMDNNGINLNLPTVFDNKELFDALELTRLGGNAALFDQMFAGLNISGVTTGGYGTIGTCVTFPASPTLPLPAGAGQEGCGANQVMQHGSAHLRRNTTYTANLANGNYVGVINSLANTNTATGLQAPPAGVPNINARVLRNGCDRLANGMTNIPTRCFPEDYFIAAPQFGTATYVGNIAHNNYHSMQAQYTLRPVHGTSLQATYTWQKLLSDRYNTFVDPRNRSADYSLDYISSASELRTTGTFELPIGPNRPLFGNSSGWVARTLERWQVNLIYIAVSGEPRDTYVTQKLYAGGGGNQPQARPNIVGPWENPKTDYKWNGPNGNTGTIFGFPSPYTVYQDPQCTSNVGDTDSMGFNLRSSCTMNGLAKIAPAGTPGARLMADGVTYAIPMLENPLPGTQGNQPARMLRLPGRWTLDANVSKAFRIGETRSVQVRVDATNILNHSNPGEPLSNVQSANFGQVTARQGASRAFQGQVRLTF